MIRAAMMMLAAAIASAPLEAQVAEVAVFGPMQSPAITTGDGARISARSEFTLYELGQWAQPDRATAVYPATPMTLPAAAPLSIAARPARTACGQIVAPARALETGTSMARRAFWPLIADAECRFGLPAGLMDSVVLAESRYDPTVVSPAGAAGLAQLMPGTAASLGVIDRFDPGANVTGGARYLRRLLDGFRGNVPLAIAAYNAGPAAVRHVRGIPLNGETPGYVRRVLGYWTAPGIGLMSPMPEARQTAQMLGFSPRVTK